jgi:hypothetical protein
VRTNNIFYKSAATSDNLDVAKFIIFLIQKMETIPQKITIFFFSLSEKKITKLQNFPQKTHTHIDWGYDHYISIIFLNMHFLKKYSFFFIF